MQSPRRLVVACRLFMVVLVVAGATLALAACGGSGGGGSSRGGDSGAPLPTGKLADDPEVLEGRTLFSQYCSSCHGVSGGGAVGPKFTDGRLLTDFPTVDDQVAFVKNGKGAMPAWGNTMTESEIRAVVRYEREVLSKPAK